PSRVEQVLPKFNTHTTALLSNYAQICSIELHLTTPCCYYLFVLFVVLHSLKKQNKTQNSTNKCLRLENMFESNSRPLFSKKHETCLSDETIERKVVLNLMTIKGIFADMEMMEKKQTNRKYRAKTTAIGKKRKQMDILEKGTIENRTVCFELECTLNEKKNESEFETSEMHNVSFGAAKICGGMNEKKNRKRQKQKCKELPLVFVVNICDCRHKHSKNNLCL
ncbi:hypothetical protein RFI_08355, partial [Reticulomyxa filosa]